MSTTEPQRIHAPYPTDPAAYQHDSHGETWLSFAGVMLALAGALNVIHGTAAIAKSSFFVSDARYVFGDLNTWGWVLLVLGLAQVAVAIGVWARVRGVRWIGVVVVSLNAIAQMLVIPAYPFWGLILFSVDIIVIFSLIAYGASARSER